MTYKHDDPRGPKIPRAKYKITSWREYDQALQQRDSLTVWVTPAALEAWTPAKSGQRGRPTSRSDIVIETAVMLRSIIGLLGLDLTVPEPVRASAATLRHWLGAAPAFR
jgi:hypothetical protein